MRTQMGCRATRKITNLVVIGKWMRTRCGVPRIWFKCDLFFSDKAREHRKPSRCMGEWKWSSLLCCVFLLFKPTTHSLWVLSLTTSHLQSTLTSIPGKSWKYTVIFAVVIWGRVIPATNSLTTCKCEMPHPSNMSKTTFYHWGLATTGCLWKWKNFGVDLQYFSLQSRNCIKCQKCISHPTAQWLMLLGFGTSQQNLNSFFLKFW